MNWKRFQPTYTETAEPDASSAQDLTTEEMEIIKGQQVSANMQLTAEEMQSIRGKKIIGVNFKKFIRWGSNWTRRFNFFRQINWDYGPLGESVHSLELMSFFLF